jgi:hypothetical protein
VKISDAFRSKYLRANDLDADEEIEAIIVGAQTETMRDGQKKPVLHFDDGGALVLNATNARAIASKLGDDTETWRGHVIMIHRSVTDFPQPDTPCLRVRVPQSRTKVENVRPMPLHTDDDMNDEVPFN